MRLLRRPWSDGSLDEGTAFGPSDCLLGEYQGDAPRGLEYVTLLNGRVRDKATGLALIPYPKRDHAVAPAREGFPVRPRKGHDPATEAEEEGAAALQHMNEVLARIQELEEALEDPSDTWGRLRAAWNRAENEADPKMAEIVQQARQMKSVLLDLEKRIRRVLRRDRELTPLDRVQEMDRASMVWLSKQPGGNIPERAGSSQRILATVRRENFDTLENRVLHAYARLATDVAREWMREHPRAKSSDRYAKVEGFRKSCRAVAKTLADLGVMVAPASITPNYVLMQDRSYREVHKCWLKLLLRRKIEDNLWAWQAETWTDFVVLSIILAIDELDEAELVAQSPISWNAEAVSGRWFEQDRPIAVFWLRDTNRIVEVQARPEKPGPMLSVARANVALRISDPSRSDLPRRVAVWTPHAMRRISLRESADEAAILLQRVQSLAQTEVLRHGLIMTPARGYAEAVSAICGKTAVKAIALGPAGADLANGFEAVRDFIRSEIYEAAE
jgi:hypothetical protein